MSLPEIDHPEEKLDLVDANDQPIGVIDRAEILQLEENKRGFARAVLVFLLNEDGQLWIPVRAPHKKVAPNGLDGSVGEHVGQGETYEAAAIRGMDEELAIKSSADELEYVGTVPPFPGIPYFHKVYLYSSNDIPSYNKDDMAGYEWLAPQQLVDRLESGAKAKEIMLPAVKLIMEKKS